MKLREILGTSNDDEPMVVRMLMNHLDAKRPVKILDRNGEAWPVMFVKKRDPDGAWVIRYNKSETEDITKRRLEDLRFPADAEVDYLLDIHSKDGVWLLKPNWHRIRELGYH
jgi:hypothetical protein